MDLKDTEYSLNCSWEVLEDGILRDLITFGNADDPLERSNFDDEIEHSIDEDKFVKLKRAEKNEGCMLSIVLEDPCLKIVKLSIVCEARMVELYGNFGEYVRTENCTLLENSSEKCFYNAQPNISPSKEVAIKFLKLDELTWLYGIKLLVRREGPPPSSYFDYKNVEEILKYSKIPISEKAEKAKRFLQNYAKVFSNNPPKSEQQVLLKMLEEQYLSQFTPVGGVSRNMSKYLSNLIPSKPKANDNNLSYTDLKQYVDKSIQQLEERVHDKISKQIRDLEAKQNEKLDSIIQLLTKS